MKKYNNYIIESKQRMYGKSNEFSEGHRKYLPSNCYMVDLDAVYLDKDGSIKYVVEDKFYFANEISEKIDDPRSWQRKALYYFCETIGAELILNEKSIDLWLQVEGNINKPFDKNELQNYTYIKTDNEIYLEIRNRKEQELKTIAIMYLIDTDLNIINFLRKFYKIFEVKIKNVDKIEIKNQKSSIFYINKPEDWLTKYKWMGLI